MSRLSLLRSLVLLGVCVACAGSAGEGAATHCTAVDALSDSAAAECQPMAGATDSIPAPQPPPGPADESLRPAITAMLRAVMDSTLPLPDSAAPPAPPRLVCLAGEPMPRGEQPYDARLRFLADPDSALLAALARPAVLLFHPRRCPPTLETTARQVSAPRRPPGEDPTYVSVRELVEPEDGLLYADVSVSRGARGAFWICGVVKEDLTMVRCTAARRTWTQ